MKPTNLLLCFAVIVTASAIGAIDKGRNVAVVGIWRGEWEHLPAATLNITDDSARSHAVLSDSAKRR